MEESLNKKDINPIDWLNQHLDMNRPESLETQLTELTFNLQNYQNELESVILASKESVEKFSDNLDVELENIEDDYEYINRFIKMNFGEMEIQKLKTNDDLFQQINERNLYKTRINNCLDVLEEIISLDFHIEEISNLLENGDIYALEKKITKLHKPLNIILKLPLIHPLHEKIERLMKSINSSLHDILA